MSVLTRKIDGRNLVISMVEGNCITMYPAEKIEIAV